MRGRKPESEALQDAKGNPGKRLPRRRRAAKQTPEDRAAALAGAPPADASAASSQSLAAPALNHPRFLAEPKLKEALAIWRELEPELTRLHLLDRLDRFTFAMYCVHMADWITATRDIRRRGQWRNVKNVNGDPLPRMNPSVKVRELAERHLLDIGARFGLDPANRYKLMRDQAAAPEPNPDLFNRQRPQPTAGGPVAEQAPPAQPVAAEGPARLPSPLGLMESLASPPPGSLPN